MSKILKTLFLLFFLIKVDISSAGVIVGGTRVIYNGDIREATLSVRNPDKNAYLIQAWADNGYEDGGQGKPIKSPFLVTPPLFRLDAGAENIIRIINSRVGLSDSQESLSWMNIKSIPAMSDDDKNILQISVKTRIKLIYRPKMLGVPGDKDYSQLTFKKGNGKLIINNPTPYYMSFNSLFVGGVEINDVMLMVAPKSTSTFTYPVKAQGDLVKWVMINDYGGVSREYIGHL